MIINAVDMLRGWMVSVSAARFDETLELPIIDSAISSIIAIMLYIEVYIRWYMYVQSVYMMIYDSMKSLTYDKKLTYENRKRKTLTYHTWNLTYQKSQIANSLGMKRCYISFKFHWIPCEETSSKYIPCLLYHPHSRY